MVTRDPKLAAEGRRRRTLLLGGLVMLLLAVLIAVLAVAVFGEDHPSGYTPPSDPIVPMPE